MSSKDIPALIYDGECGLCRASVDWLQRRLEPGTLEFIPCQDEAREVRFPHIDTAECLTAIQLAFPDGTVLAGADALGWLLLRLPRWRWIGRALRLPGLRRLAPVVYRWIARRRKGLSQILVRKAPASCEADEQCRRGGPG